MQPNHRHHVDTDLSSISTAVHSRVDRELQNSVAEMAKSRMMSASMKQVPTVVVVVLLLGFLVAMVQAKVEGQVSNVTSSWDSFMEKGAGVVSSDDVTSPPTTTPGESFAAENVTDSSSTSNEVGDVGTGGKLVSDVDSTYTDFGNSSFANDQYYAGGDDQATENLFGDFSAISNPAPTTDLNARFNDVTFDFSETPDVDETMSDR